ncbi:ATP-binding protein [Flavobacterium beibuense]|uniref:histidine kinase n=1 Tax=Flavobacterium beibuense TaxID=657326 RepID=A0A444WA55_9FLAO|nr:ATP-binding protein [Flavobacterium beibuense]RYJ42536.1 Multi-sensor signal transduction histidine kinase [Flavobacterium beibuense]
MNIKDIVNRDIVNLTNCEQEPIHIPGSIQPHGFLLAVNTTDFKIEFCSGNSYEYIGIKHQDILGKTIDSVFVNNTINNLKDYISKDLMLSASLLKLELNGKNFLCTVHKRDNLYIIEAEPASVNEKDISFEYNQTAQLLGYMHDTHTLKELCQLVAEGTRDITGYDRVMIYRFDKNYNGEVYAESVREDLEPFLGLHYPHTDIPKQARELYMQNLLRIITDVDYTPVPIYTIDNSTEKNLDLSLSILRSTSPIHVQYLHNMGVGATLTISLIHQKKLWGLIACHHYSPKNLAPDLRLAAQLQGHFITSQIDIRQKNEEYELSLKTSSALDKVKDITLTNAASFKALVNSKQLLELCNASGVSVLFNNSVYKSGITPDDEEIKKISSWLSTYTQNGSLHTDKLIDLLPEYKNVCENTSGIIYHSLDIENDNSIIWYRPETVKEINWAGDPNKSIEKDEKGLSPRKSFDLWKEVVKCQSSPWEKPEIDTAANYAYRLQRQINLLVVTNEEQKYRKLSELLKETNSELENINWISTHDLQEPLRKIQLVSSRILSTEKNIPEKVEDAIKRMNSSANRMQTLLVDILKYTRLKHEDSNFETVDLTELIKEVVDELHETIEEKEATVNIDVLPQVQGVPFLLKQLFSNLISNSIKYSSPDRKPVVQLSAEKVPVAFNSTNRMLYKLVYVADNGIGFEQEYAESIFNIFTRLHSPLDYKGSGVGLALCKKIVQNHNGYITASGKLGEGAVISIYFPANNEET